MFGSSRSPEGVDNTPAATPSVVAAAKWWGNQLRGPVAFSKDDWSKMRGVSLFMFVLGSGDKLSEESVTAFEKELIRLISLQLQEAGPRGAVSIAVQHTPDQILLNAAEKAGISLGPTRLPRLTSMLIEENDVSIVVESENGEKTIQTL